MNQSPVELKVDAFDQWGFQCDGEVVQCLKDAYKGIESGGVSEHCCVLIHLQDHWTLHEQGEPRGQQAVSVGQIIKTSVYHILNVNF